MKDEVVGLQVLGLWLPTVDDLGSGVLYWKDNTEGCWASMPWALVVKEAALSIPTQHFNLFWRERENRYFFPLFFFPVESLRLLQGVSGGGRGRGDGKSWWQQERWGQETTGQEGRCWELCQRGEAKPQLLPSENSAGMQLFGDVVPPHGCPRGLCIPLGGLPCLPPLASLQI